MSICILADSKLHFRIDVIFHERILDIRHVYLYLNMMLVKGYAWRHGHTCTKVYPQEKVKLESITVPIRPHMSVYCEH